MSLLDRFIRKTKENEGVMGILEHTEELSVRLIRCLWIFLGGFVFSYFFLVEGALEILRRPLFDVLPADQQKLYFTGLFDNFMVHLKVAGHLSLVLFSPFYFFQLWSFLSPGLVEKEKKMAIPFVAASTVFFPLGVLFAYYVVFPAAFKFFVSYGLPSDFPMLTIDSYYGTAMKLMLLFGLGFELPVIIVLLGYLRLVDATFLRTHRRYAYLGITVVSAMFAPPDAISMLMMMAPLFLFFELAIKGVELIQRNEAEVAAAGSPEFTDSRDPMEVKAAPKAFHVRPPENSHPRQ